MTVESTTPVVYSEPPRSASRGRVLAAPPRLRLDPRSLELAQRPVGLDERSLGARARRLLLGRGLVAEPRQPAGCGSRARGRSVTRRLRRRFPTRAARKAASSSRAAATWRWLGQRRHDDDDGRDAAASEHGHRAGRRRRPRRRQRHRVGVSDGRASAAAGRELRREVRPRLDLGSLGLAERSLGVDAGSLGARAREHDLGPGPLGSSRATVGCGSRARGRRKRRRARRSATTAALVERRRDGVGDAIAHAVRISA